MQKDSIGTPIDRDDHATQALNDLTSTLEEYPEVDAVFRHLSHEEQAGLVEWIDKADNPKNRKRRVRMICAVLTRTGKEGLALKDLSEQE